MLLLPAATSLCVACAQELQQYRWLRVDSQERVAGNAGQTAGRTDLMARFWSFLFLFEFVGVSRWQIILLGASTD